MGFAVEDKHLKKCLRVNSSNDYLTDFDGMPNSFQTYPENFV